MWESYNTRESLQIAQIFRKLKITNHRANSLLSILLQKDFDLTKLAPSWHILTQVELKNLKQRV